ncbi:MAG: tetratricopeptide repeat protein, partial [Promethearchaeota archaeon]
EMLEIFHESEIDIKMKKASVLRRMRDIESGLDIINELLEQYPKNYDLLNYKVYWLQYLNRKKEALKLIQELVDEAPYNGTYHDTYGELLMYNEDYEKAIEKFLKAIEIVGDDWFINQTYIKLGICYKELKQFDLAFESLKKGKSLTNESIADSETKQKWLTIADLFLTEIKKFL